VVKLPADLHFCCLPDRHILDERQVPIGSTGEAQGPPGSVAVGPLSRAFHCVGVKPPIRRALAAGELERAGDDWTHPVSAAGDVGPVRRAKPYAGGKTAYEGGNARKSP